MAVDPWTLLLYVGIAIGALIVLYLAIWIVLSATKLAQVKEQTQQLHEDAPNEREDELKTIRNAPKGSGKKNRSTSGKAKRV